VTGQNTLTGKKIDATTSPARRALPAWAAAALVFGSSGAVLLLEVLATRLVAPYIGINLQVNSAVIGTALAAIALGAWAGGRLADSRDPHRLIGPMLLVGGVTTLLVLPSVRRLGLVFNGTDTTAVVVLAALAIFVPAAILSTVSPLVVKSQLRDLRRTGRVVGRLSGLGTLGGIVATFLTGFVLVASLPSSVILLSVGGLLVVGGVVTDLALRARRRLALGLVTLALISGILTVQAPAGCLRETAYNCVNIVAHPTDPSVLILKLSTSEHSYVDMDEPTRLHMGYVQVIASAIDQIRPGDALDGLHIGGGGLTLPTYLTAVRPAGRQLVYEIDPGLIEVDRSHLGFRDSPRLAVVPGDGRIGLQDQHDASYDVVVEDAFGVHSPPWHLTTRETSEHARRVLRPGGIYAVNAIDFPPARFGRSMVSTLRAVFPHVVLVSFQSILDGHEGGNIVALASSDPIPTDRIRQAVAARDETKLLVVSDEAGTARYAQGAPVLIDDFAPVDQMITIPARYW